ncbi:hypothetical protein BRARA_H01515 [Brassica rapa]|uniref:E3 ubiquitin-protein ligase RMA n=1 Tax=Brassica campestris TaxID=3711 RepID=M4D1Q3_BRACM|nr:hypothetical protein BRARA_H01515 [Brassica rapa]
MEGNFSRSDPQQAANEDGFSLKQKPNLTITAQPNESGCFDCNICLDTAHDPVVTLCGHLFCWPCIYKWLHVKLSPVSIDHHHNTCPVCKSSVAITSLVPLYGRGMSSMFSPRNKPQTYRADPVHQLSLHNHQACHIELCLQRFKTTDTPLVPSPQLNQLTLPVR